MFFEILGKIPTVVGVGCSGGVDSLAIVHFLIQNRSRQVHMHYIWHNIPDSQPSLDTVKRFFEKHSAEYKNLFFHYHDMPEPDSGVNDEHFWHKERYKIFNSLPYDVITGHHIGDQCETWIMGALNGNAFLIPYRTKNVIRPFLLCEKSKFMQYCYKHSVQYYTDEYNSDLSYRRNRIRHEVMPTLENIHPGFVTTMKNKTRSAYYASMQ